MIYTAEIPLQYHTPHIHIKDKRIFNTDVMNAKLPKILSHQFCPGDISIWVDGNIEVLLPESDIINKYLGDCEIGIFKHPFRKTVYEEFKVLYNYAGVNPRFMQKNLKTNLRNQNNYYVQQNYLANNGLFECNFIIRRHTKNVIDFNNRWWSEICRWQHRDQVSFPFVLWQMGADAPKLKVTVSNIRTNRDFKHIKKY